jgi:DNA-binding transcriptional ArsR family regulator
MPSSSATDDLFRALASSTRRRILDLLAEHGELTVGELAAEFPDLVASGISKHLMELRDAGLVHATRLGRQQLYRIEGIAFAEALAPWLARYEVYWTDALDRLRHLAESGHPPESERRTATSREQTGGDR